MIDDTHEALFHLADTLLRPGTTVEENVGQGVGTSETSPSWVGQSRDGPSHTKDPFRSPDPTRFRDHTRHAYGLEHYVIPHPCIACGNICYGPSLEFHGDGLLQYVNKTRSSHSLLFFISHFSIVS